MRILCEILFLILSFIIFDSSCFIFNKINTTKAVTQANTSVNDSNDINENKIFTADKLYTLRTKTEGNFQNPSSTLSTRDPMIDYLWRIPKSTTSFLVKPVTMGDFMKNMYTKYNVKFETNVNRVIIRIPYNNDTLISVKSTKNYAENEIHTKSYLDSVLNVWLKDKNKKDNSFKDKYAGMPMKAENIPNYDTFFGRYP